LGNRETIVVGGGAAGIRAAISAAEGGAAVSLLEGNDRLGRKILISGNGRCNLTNRDADRIGHYHGGNPSFAGPALAAHPVADSLRFFRDLGIETKEEKRARLFPCSDQAQSIVDVLTDRMNQLGVEIATSAKVSSLSRDRDFHIQCADGRQWRSDRVILASGGVSLSKLGADDSGIRLAESLGHSATGFLPGLVPLICNDACVHKMHGVKTWAEVTARPGNGKRSFSDVDDLLLTKYGVSGFVILNLSARLVPLLEDGEVELSINLFPGKTAEHVSELLKVRWEQNGHRSLEFSFAGLLSGKIVKPLLERFELPGERQVSQISKAERWKLAQILTSWSIVVSEPRSFDYAEVMIGGIRTEEIDSQTLESYIVPGLYFAGEMVDIHGDLGGYNFQWAWSSGFVAGERRGS